jgi:glycine/D-amino acid oxidase-like deaminating enzyme
VAWFPGEGYLLTGAMIGHLVDHAAARGARVVTGEHGRVTGLEATGSGWAVRTAAGPSIPADVVVCCAGTQVPRLAALAGAVAPIPLVPWAEPGARAPGLVVLAGPVAPGGLTRMVHTPRVHLRPHAGGLVHLEAPDAAVDLHTPEEELRRWAAELLDRARRVTGGLDDAAVTGYRVCVRPMPADGQSVVGWLPGAPGVYVAVTHSGVTLGAHLAGLMAAELISGAAEPELAPYRPGRFTAGYPQPSGR